MKDRREIEVMREAAYIAQGFLDDGSRPPVVEFRDRMERAYAEGVEAALLWVLGSAGAPFASR